LPQRPGGRPVRPYNATAMQAVLNFLAMGGYAAFVWPAYAAAALILAVLTRQSLNSHRRRQRELDHLQRGHLQQGRTRRGRAA
jgi:heme exporter protein D